MIMFSKDMLIGIILGLSKTDIYLDRNDKSQIGYRVRLRVNLRANASFLLAVKRSLEQHQIKTTYKETEHKTRQKPILRIGGIKNLYRLCELVPANLPDSKEEWVVFREAVEIVANDRHLQLEGLEKLFELKGVE
tara:strand:+ start:5279 stop:5683 length:405 start_codon:yes stop_codon:yes gene_type:complete